MSVQFQRFVSADRRRQTSSWNHADHHHHLISKSVRSKVRISRCCLSAVCVPLACSTSLPLTAHRQALPRNTIRQCTT